MALWLAPATGVLDRIAAAMQAVNAHAARTVVVLPYAQLLPLVKRLWAQRFPQGFVPRFETTMNWSSALQTYAPQSADLRFDMALDLLTAQVLLASAGLAEHAQALAPRLVQAALQLAPLASACAPAHRPAWAHTARKAAVVGMDAPELRFETVVARVAVEWVTASGYPSDVLFDTTQCGDVDVLFFVRGLNADPLIDGLKQVWGDRLQYCDLAADVSIPTGESAGMVAYACQDDEDEARCTVACALQHIALGEFPLALVSSDRALTRRVRSMLELYGVRMRDETGWKLSTSAAAAQVMALLKACTWNASTDSVLAWLKLVPGRDQTTDTLEALLRRQAVRGWRAVGSLACLQDDPDLMSIHQEINQSVAACQGRKRLADWLDVLQSGLHAWGCWEPLLLQGAGWKVAEVLRLLPESRAQLKNPASATLWSDRTMDLSDFTAWVNQTLEAASFQPEYPDEEQVAILPMSQMVGRPFAAVLLAGCDEIRLNPAADPPGDWTRAQRAALGLPTRQVIEDSLRSAWHYALQTPKVDVLWRTSDDRGETLNPSVLVQLLQSESRLVQGHQPQVLQSVSAAPTLPPQPTGQALAQRHWSASAYEDLRQCPYRYFALRLLGLRSVDELDKEVEKRDFGLWLHAVLQSFHEALQVNPHLPPDQRRSMLDQCSEHISTQLGLSDSEFLPFKAAWPAVRDGYLQWYAEHEATQACFEKAEVQRVQTIGPLQLQGRLDRIDTLPDGQKLLVDYKTEALATTRARVKAPLEDTQMVFYAALMEQDSVRGMYVNVGETDGTKACEQQELMDARDALIDGLLQDTAAIEAGAVLPALGDGSVCDYCDVRGLCRKDFWQ
jgi:ATP-dependent helicase/nuclease subunit B